MKHTNKFKTIPRRLYIVASTLILAVVGAYLLTRGHAASIGVMSLSPSSSQVSYGSNFVVTVTEDSGTVGVSTAQVDLVYDSTRLDVVSFDATAAVSAMPCADTGVPPNPNLCSAGNGTVKLALAKFNGVLTGPQTIAKITFKAKALGAANVSFASTSALVQPPTTSTPATNILSTTNGATYTVSDTSVPTTPTALTATPSTTGVGLSWTASTDNVGVTGYKIFRNGGTTPIGTSTTASYNDTGLVPNTTYTYAVTAFDAAGNNSVQATLTTKTTPDTALPSTPGGLTAGTKTMTSNNFSWTASTDNVGVTGYKIFRNGGTTPIGTSTTTSYTDTGLTPGSSYTYTVSAFDAAGNNSTASSSISVATIVKPGDVDGNNKVDIYDLSTLATYYGQSGKTRAQGDLDGNGIVNIYDLSILATYWGS